MNISFISDFIDIIIKNPVIVLIIMICTPLGIFISIKSKRKKSFKFCGNYIVLIENFIQNINGLNIKYFENDIKSFTIARFIFWNNGNETIRNSDIPSKDKFCIEIKNNYNILNASLLKVTNDSNNVSFKLSENKKILYIYFEYLDKHDGFVLQIFHNSSDSKPFIINGSIMGFGEIKKGFTIVNSPFSKILGKFFKQEYHSYIRRIIYFIIILIYILSLMLNNDIFTKCLFIFMLLFLILDSNLFSVKIPKRLKEYFEQILL